MGKCTDAVCFGQSRPLPSKPFWKLPEFFFLFLFFEAAFFVQQFGYFILDSLTLQSKRCFFLLSNLCNILCRLKTLSITHFEWKNCVRFSTCNSSDGTLVHWNPQFATVMSLFSFFAACVCFSLSCALTFFYISKFFIWLTKMLSFW